MTYNIQSISGNNTEFYAHHPLAEIFPLLSGDDFRALVDDVAERGLLEPIVLYQDMILDGRNRYNACLAANVEPRFDEYTGNDPLGYVIAKNLHRRHLNESQRAVVAARLATMRQGARTDIASIDAMSQPQAAKMLNVSRPSVQRANVVLDDGIHALVDAVEKGEIPVSQAAKIAQLPQEQQQAVVETVRIDGVRAQEAMRRVKAETIAQNEAVMPSGKYRVFYADPPWSYGNTQPDYHPEQRDHYAVMSLADICALPVSDMALDDAVLFLWVTSPILEDAFQVIKAWGFKYKASFVWDKVKHNMGHYNSVRHEFLLVCVRGSCQPDERKLFDSVVTIERGEHSEKPERFREIIDTIYPLGTRIELFARKRTEGWDAFGNELLP